MSPAQAKLYGAALGRLQALDRLSTLHLLRAAIGGTLSDGGARACAEIATRLERIANGRQD